MPRAPRSEPEHAVARTPKWVATAFVAGPLLFIAAQAGQSLLGAWPPESSVGLFFYSLELGWMIIVALGVTAVLVAVPGFRQGLAGFFAVGFLWLAVLSVIQTFRDAAVDLMVAQSREAELSAAGERWWTYEAAHANLLVWGVGVAFMGLALTRSGLTHPAVGYVGVALGGLTALLTYVRFVLLGAAWAEPFPVLVLTFVWLVVLGVAIYRRARTA